MSTLGDFLAISLPKKEPLVEGLLYRRDNCSLVGRRRHAAVLDAFEAQQVAGGAK